MRIGIIGVTGYTGSELLRILLHHPGVHVTYVTSHSFAGKPLAEVHPHFQGIIDLTCQKFEVEEARRETDLVFCALPHGESMEAVAQLYRAGLKVIDLSADYRLHRAGDYRTWYQREHTVPELLGQAVYGLPEFNREKIRRASLVANPGCYPTSVLLALAPLTRQEGLVDWNTLVVDAKSGASGAGRVPSPVLHYPECTENFRAYRVAVHQHAGEMEQELGMLLGKTAAFTFVPHLVPMVRGILSTTYLTLATEMQEEDIREVYRNYYSEAFFVRVLPQGLFPETRNVYGSNFCDLGLHRDRRTGRLILISALDNLVKGAAGQAVQNMNLMLGIEETSGLKFVPLRP